MQSLAQRPQRIMYLLWLGLITLAAAWLPIAISVAEPQASHRAHPSAPIVDGHDIQPRAYQFTPPYGQPDVSRGDTRTIEQLYDLLLRREHMA